MLKRVELNGFSQFAFDMKASLKICACKLFFFGGGGGGRGEECEELGNIAIERYL